MSAAPVEDDSDVLPNDNVDPNYMLSELHRQVFLYNAKEAGKLAQKGGKTLTYGGPGQKYKDYRATV
jgi:hypothetical protein